MEGLGVEHKGYDVEREPTPADVAIVLQAIAVELLGDEADLLAISEGAADVANQRTSVFALGAAVTFLDHFGIEAAGFALLMEVFGKEQEK